MLPFSHLTKKTFCICSLNCTAVVEKERILFSELFGKIRKIRRDEPSNCKRLDCVLMKRKPSSRKNYFEAEKVPLLLHCCQANFGFKATRCDAISQVPDVDARFCLKHVLVALLIFQVELERRPQRALNLFMTLFFRFPDTFLSNNPNHSLNFRLLFT